MKEKNREETPLFVFFTVELSLLSVDLKGYDDVPVTSDDLDPIGHLFREWRTPLEKNTRGSENRTSSRNFDLRFGMCTY